MACFQADRIQVTLHSKAQTISKDGIKTPVAAEFKTVELF